MTPASENSPQHTPQQLRSARNITATLFAVQGLGSAAVITSATIATIVGADITGRTSLAGFPAGVGQLGAAFSALLWSFIADRMGRRLGLALGLVIGASGAALAGFAVMQGSFVLLLLGLVIMASARASYNLGRFVAAEVNPPQRRGRAVAFVVLGGTVGSVLGPLLVASSSDVARGFGFNALAGPYVMAGVLFLLAGIVLFLFLYPEPKKLALEIAANDPKEKFDVGTARPFSVLIREPAILTAMASMVLGYAVMVLLMGITALHMKQNAYELGPISVVFSAHTFGMFAFSVLTGYLIDKWGRYPVIFSGAIILLASCLLAPLSTAFWPLFMALFLLGLGWNFCYVGGSTLLSDNLSPAEKAATQGTNDLFIGLMSATVSAVSGYLLATIGYGGLGIVGAVLSGLLLVIAFQLRKPPSSPKLIGATD